MKTNRSYLTKMLMAQLLALPIVITIGSFIVGNILLSSNIGTEIGYDASKLLNMLAAFIGALLAGIAFGYIFSSRSKNKPHIAKQRYLPLLIPTIYAGIIAILVMVLSNGDPGSQLWLIFLFKNPTYIILHFSMMFMGNTLTMIIVEIMGYVGFVLGFLIYEVKTNSIIKDETTKFSKLVISTVFVAAVLFMGIGARDVINNGIVELMYGKSTIGEDLTEYDLYQMAPFREENLLIKPDKKPALQFLKIEEMPKLDGATAAYPVYAAFAEALYKGLGDYYEKNKNNVDKDYYSAFVDSEEYPLNIIKCSKTTGAYERLIKGEVDIIFVAEPSKDQVEAIKAKGDDFVLTPIASEAFVFFTNIKNPVNNLKITQVQDIYSGKITNWKEVGGQNKKILPYQRPENSGSQTVMENKVMKNSKMIEPDVETYAGGMGDIIKKVASYKNAKNSIGYSFLYYSSSMMKNNQIKYIAIDGIKPTPETVRNKTYSFTVPVYAVRLKSNTNENVTKMINWILSSEGQEIIAKTGYVPMNY
jgi:phosphate transport system substrate-binding protein